jgi:effector-binding domain-containing protein
MTEVMFAATLPRTLASVRKRVRQPIAAAFPQTLDKVWAFLRANPGIWQDGHNVFLYHHEPGGRLTSPAGLEVDFGVEVSCSFPDAGDVRCIETPVGEAAIAIHRGPYQTMYGTHQPIHAAIAAKGRRVGGHSLEIYGDQNDDPSKLETEIIYLLA